MHGFRREPEIARVAAEAGVPAIAMYNHRGREFHDTIGNVIEGLLESLRIAREQGLPEDRIIVDPGFNFGWTDEQALEMLRRLARAARAAAARFSSAPRASPRSARCSATSPSKSASKAPPRPSR